MPRTAWIAGGCALALAAAALTVAIVGDDGTTPSAHVTTSVTTTRSPTPSATTTVPISTTAPSLPANVTAEIAAAAMPAASGPYEAAEQKVTLSAICAGAVLDASPPTAAYYRSLQTVATPLRYLDVAVIVHPTSEAAAGNYGVVESAVKLCPTSRQVTPTPSPTERPVPVQIEGAATATDVAGLRAIQWVQLQTSTAQSTSLRSAITVVVFQNALIAVSMDEDSESTTREQLAADCRAAAAKMVAAMQAAIG